MDKKIIVGFPRSGTCSMSKKYNLGHEKRNKNGISDWHLVFDDDIMLNRNKFELIHVIRNPINTISSNFFTMLTSSLNFIINKAEIEDKSLLSTVVEGFIKWTKRIEELNPDKIIRIEEEDIIENTRKHPTFKWKDLEILPVELLNKLKEIAIEYGYDPND